LRGHHFIENLLDQSKKIVTSHEIPNIMQDDKSLLTDYGKYVSIELNSLIERIYVSPLSEDWHIDLVESIVKKYKINKQIIKSDLYSLK
jgi:hypothetical protein